MADKIKKQDSTVLVVGGDGLLGSHLVRQLIMRGFAVRVLVHPKSTSPTLDDQPVEKITGDLLDDSPVVEQAMKGCRYVFHLAAITDLWANPDLVWKVNFDGTRKVLDACVKQGIDRLIFTGSASAFQFGTLDNPGDEQGAFPSAYQGIPYMESKFKAAELVRKYVKRGDLDAVIVAPTFMLGDLDAGPSSGELIRQFIVRALRFTSPGGRNFACATDVAAAMISATEKGRAGESYLAGGRNMLYSDFFAEVARIADMRPPRWVLPPFAVVAAGAMGSLAGKFTKGRAPLDLRTARLSILDTYYTADKAVKELGMPQTPVETGIKDTIRGLKEFGHI